MIANAQQCIFHSRRSVRSNLIEDGQNPWTHFAQLSFGQGALFELRCIQRLNQLSHRVISGRRFDSDCRPRRQDQNTQQDDDAARVPSSMLCEPLRVVIPAKAGIQFTVQEVWIPHRVVEMQHVTLAGDRIR